ncbi:alpha/beta fold hydrolase [Variovorax sp. Sphag1AA]|uniref:alpha/beta hydrolase family protein n=1 Tax=Variovorax sp. Sphag1AA TaxID=2587027 RepID=UPI00161A36EA|nr:alpha/beta fold hydrolase [Variovorax sp. Sphag1AA]MBB3181173.1 putative dienelactone hydrolase [Variovorax sp. Sphag1AA]
MRISQRGLLLALGLSLSINVLASQAGFRTVSVPGLPAEPEPIPVALFYPTQAPERSIAMGPFTVHAAIGGTPDAQVKGLIVLSHGHGGSELAHASLAEALARHGYLVAALRHPGDNWQDSSLLGNGPARYFTARPQQASRVIDALLQDPSWKDRIARDAKGPRVGAVGHSAGGYTVLALAGGEPELQRLTTHCANNRADDPILCSLTGKPAMTKAGATDQAEQTLTDSRVRAVVALAPLGAVLSARSLTSIKTPTLVYEADLDRYLIPRFHAEWIVKNAPNTELRRVPNASHWAFMDTPSMPISTPDGDVGADPTGFDRAAFLKQLGNDIPAYFDAILNSSGDDRNARPLSKPHANEGVTASAPG